jgi:pyruvate/2-oxoglutarate dehydrogenase complex dihydrolipoamide dehydrogenase (E3) component
LDERVMSRTWSVVVLGGGPGGYEAALVAARLGASVTVVDRDGLGGSCVLTDCVPEQEPHLDRARPAADGRRSRARRRLGAHPRATDLRAVNARILDLAAAQSADIHARLEADGVRVCRGTGRLLAADRVRVDFTDGGSEDLDADVVLVATGATPRVMPTAVPDGERILTWTQIWGLTEVPERLVVVGSGVTGAELAQAYLGLGSAVTLVSSRDQVLPGEDSDAAGHRGGLPARGHGGLSRSRMSAVERTTDGVLVAWRTDAPSRAAMRCSPSAPSRRRRASGSRTSASSSAPVGTSSSTASRAPPCAACMPRATAPACSRWRR